MTTQYITPSLASDAVQVDPNNPGTVFHVAAALEASFNILGATVMFFFPAQLLSYSVNSSTAINPTTTLLVQILGLMVYGLTPQLVAAIPQTRTGIQSRPTVYLSLLAGELFLVPFMLYEALIARNRVSGMTNSALLVMASNLFPIIVWRLYVMYVKPEWMGRYNPSSGKKQL